MHRFENSYERWWQKPLVVTLHGIVPAELAVLFLETSDDEEGVWINSRGTKTGVSDLNWEAGKAKTIRVDLPEAVSSFLREAYESKCLKKECPALVIWNRKSFEFRFIEVKCPIGDRPSEEQKEFMAYARSRGIPTEISEWVFKNASERK